MIKSFFPISLHSLRLESVPSFDLYILHKSKADHVLYRHKNTEFSGAVQDNLLANEVTELYVPREQRDDYFEYASREIADVVRDENLGANEKSQAVYKTTSNIMEDLFVTPRSSTRIKQAKKAINSTVDFMLHNEEATRSLIFLTSHDYYTYTHSVNVSIFSTALAQRVDDQIAGMADIKTLSEGFLLHDIGKAKIPSAIINKSGKLTDDEWEMMKKHPQWGQEILQQTGEINPTIEAIVLQHHERPNGSGYPHGLKADDIDLAAKICCIADVFDAITTVRSYRDPLTTFDALQEMRDKMGEHFDWGLFDEFVQLFHA